MKQILALILLAITLDASASRTDTILVHSTTMNKDIKCVIIQPRRTIGNMPIHVPVIYLLQGWSGSYAQWPRLAPQLQQTADSLGILFVCPDGGYRSWWPDSPFDPAFRYETFMIQELIPYIDQHYATIPDRLHRAVTGLSMGGHGGLYLGIRHSDVFGAAGATSGGVDIRPFPKNWDLQKSLGDPTEHADNWNKYVIPSMVDTLSNKRLRLIFDCGVDDFFLTVNRNLHQQLLDRKIEHDYIERPGGHNNAYWKNSIDYQILFFWKFFTASPAAQSR